MSAKSETSPRLSHILFIDDDEPATQALIRSLKRNGADFEISYASSADDGLDFVQQHRPGAVVIDLSLDPSIGPESGLKLLSDLLEREDPPRVLVLTGHGAEQFGISALQMGAASFLNRPVDSSHLLALLQDALNFSTLRRRYDELTTSADHLKERTGLSSRSSKMQSVIEAIAYASTHRQPVLLVGETGTGKGVVAHAIHHAHSGKRQSSFIRFQPNFGGADLVSSELFGHQKGAFTGATDNRVGLIQEASGGTLFIDEVDELPKETQVLLLNVLQEKKYRPLGSNRELQSDFRLLAATNRPIEECLKKGNLREDFFHRIGHLIIEVPPLRERPEDIEDLALEFLSRLVERERLDIHGFTSEALKRLRNFSWPGNVRQLQAVVEGGIYKANYLRERYVGPNHFSLNAKSIESKSNNLSFREQVQRFEGQLVETALRRNNNNQVKAAESLQLDRTTLRRIIQRGKG